MTMTHDRAAEIGARALLFLAEQPEHLGAFLAETGADPSALRDAVDQPGTLGFVLSHIGRFEELAEEFCRIEGLAPETFAAAEAALLGPTTHWT